MAKTNHLWSGHISLYMVLKTYKNRKHASVQYLRSLSLSRYHPQCSRMRTSTAISTRSYAFCSKTPILDCPAWSSSMDTMSELFEAWSPILQQYICLYHISAGLCKVNYWREIPTNTTGNRLFAVCLVVCRVCAFYRTHGKEHFYRVQ